jgi:hypothetical protein
MDAALFGQLMVVLDLQLSIADLGNAVDKLRQHERYRNLLLPLDAFALRAELVLSLLPKCCFQRDFALKKQHARDFLQEEFSLEKKQATALANRLLFVLSRLDVDRVHLYSMRRELLEKQSHRCAHCNQLLTCSAEELQRLPLDPFKPYARFPDLLEPEVDHIDAVSLFGGNDEENLQVLCKHCNRGKGNGLGVSPLVARRYAGADISRTLDRDLVTYLGSLVYYGLLHGDRRCSACASKTKPLSIRIRGRGDRSMVVANTRVLCWDCISLGG